MPELGPGISQQTRGLISTTRANAGQPTADRFKLLAVSHACIAPVNQQFYAEVARLTGWRITLVIPSRWRTEYGQTLQPERWHQFEGDILSIPVLKSGHIPLHVYRCRFSRLLKQERPNIVYIHQEPYALSTAQVVHGCRKVDCPFGFYSAQNIVKRYPLPFRRLETRAYRSASFAFPCSRTVENTLRRKNYSGPATVLPLGIDPALYRADGEAEVIRRRHRRSSAEVLVGYVGRIVHEKGVLTLLHGLAKLTDLPWRLIVVGARPDEVAFDAEACRLGLSDRLERIGVVPHEEVPAYLAAFDILAVPSETQPNWKEQFGRVIIEALACGTPVLGSDSGEIPILIRETGGGRTFREADPTDLAENLRILMSDAKLRRHLAATGRQVVLDRYTNEAVAKTFAQTVQEAYQFRN